MATQNTAIQYSFATGEVMPGIENRRDWDRNGDAITEGLNGTVLPSGGFRKRPGMRMVDECIHHDKPITLVAFKFSQNQIYQIEFGDYLMRVYYNREQILNADETPYEIATPYSAEQIAEADWAQEKDTLIFTHWDRPTKRLIRYGHANWVWSDLFRPDEEEGRLSSPEVVEWFDNASNGHNGFEYAVTAYRIENGTPKESVSYSTIASDPATVDFIPEAPQNNILSIFNWLDQYKPGYQSFDGFPTAPAVFDLRGINEDASPETGSVLNPRILAVFKLLYPSAIRGERRLYYSATSTNERWRTAWTLYASGQSGTDYLWNIYYGQDNGSSWDPGDWRVYSEYASMVAAYYYTWIMLTQALNWINNNNVSVNGQTKASIYNTAMSFIDSYNEANSQKIINHIKWTPVDGADGYFVYRRPLESEDRNFYNVATVTDATDWLDEDVFETPVGTQTPITGANSFTDPDNYPALVTFYQQRLVLGATKSKPTTIFGSRTGIYTDFTINPSDISSGYEFKMASSTSDPLKAIIPLETLVVLTSGGDFVSTVAGAMNASNVNFNQKSYNGCSDVRPVIINDNGVYIPVGQQAIHTMAYAYEKNGFKHDNRLFHAQHLTRNKRVVGLAHQRDPINLLWAVLDDGTLLSCLFIPEQGFEAWTKHVTDGRVKSVNIVPRNGVDELWLVVERTRGDGSTRQYLEVMEDIRPFGAVPEGEHAFYVDCGLSGVFDEPVSRVTGLDHLEGREVAILADDSVQTRRVVEGGAVDLDHPASIVHVGLPYVTRLRTLRFELLNQGTLRDTRSQVSEIVVEVEDCRELFVSANGGGFNELVVHDADEFGRPKLQTGDFSFRPMVPNARKAYLTFESRDPVPCSINSLVVEIKRGDG